MKKTIAYIIISIVYFVLIYTLPAVLDVHPLLILIIGVILYFLCAFAVEYLVGGDISEEKLEQKIIKKLRAEGYKCEKDEGELIYRMNGRTYRVHFWKSRRNEFRTAIIDYLKIDEHWNQISVEGQSVLANYINSENPHVTFTSNKRGVVCSFITTVSNANDFIEEAQRAYNMIGEAINTSIQILPQIKQLYPAKEKEVPIGFAKNNNSNDNSNIFNQQS